MKAVLNAPDNTFYHGRFVTVLEDYPGSQIRAWPDYTWVKIQGRSWLTQVPTVWVQLI